MNIRELEALLVELASYDDDAMVLGEALRDKLNLGVKWCKAQQRRTAKRKVEFKLRAAEQRELLR